MKLSQLVHYRNQLDKMSAMPAKQTADENINRITHLVETQSTQLGEFTTKLNQHRQTIQTQFDNFECTLNLLKAELNELIKVAEKPWFQESYRLYEEEMCSETAEYILNRRPSVSSDAEMILRARLTAYTNWKYPGMIIRPGLEPFIHDMVDLDPLYIIDQSYELLEPSMQNFTVQYQQRLRPYMINENLNYNMLDKLPNEQFGICLVYNFFNFRPFEVIKKYLTEIYSKLRPGGILIITFNDCDRHTAVDLVERHFACYTPGYLMRELATTIGYETVFAWNDGGPSTWLELRKPGVLKSLKGGQTLAKVVAKSK